MLSVIHGLIQPSKKSYNTLYTYTSNHNYNFLQSQLALIQQRQNIHIQIKIHVSCGRILFLFLKTFPVTLLYQRITYTIKASNHFPFQSHAVRMLNPSVYK